MDTTGLAEIAHRYGMDLILRFGSTVSGQVHPRSDVDIAVLLDRPSLSFREHAALLHDLQVLYPDQEVDLALLNRADPLFLKKVTDQCSLLYGSLRRLHELKLYAFKRYQDHRKYLALERGYVSRTLRGMTAS